jgi:hypothetical protein
MELVAWECLEGWTEVWSLAVVFGLASVPWTYAFVAGVGLPLWPAFVLEGLAGETVAAVVAMLLGALIGYGTDRISTVLAGDGGS